MKKLVITIVALVIIAITLGSAGYVYAQSSNPPTTPGTGIMGAQGGRGGMMGGQGVQGRMGSQNSVGDQDGILHEGMIAVYAEKLGISVDDLNTRLTNGETMAQIASSKGLTAEQFTTLMSNTRSQAVDQAVKDGTLTQAQADWMKQRGTGMSTTGGRGMRGDGQGQFTNSDCPYYQTNP